LNLRPVEECYMRLRSKFSLLPLGLAVACSTEPVTGPGTLNPDDYEGIVEAGQQLTDLTAQCDHVVTNNVGVVTLTLNSDDVAMISKATSGAILVNGYPCEVATSSNTKRIDVVQGTAGAQTLIVDYMGGQFVMGNATAAGLVVDLGDAADGDAVKIRGSKVADTYTFGLTAVANVYGVAINTDANKDITVTNVESFVVSMSDGNDVVSGAGNAATGGNAFDLDITIYGGAGNDTLRGGTGDDVYYGGEGNDTFQTGALADGADEINGGSNLSGAADVDTVDYSTRTDVLVPHLITMDDVANDGAEVAAVAGGELDNVMSDIETVKGSSGVDTITGTAGAQTIHGGPGNDVLAGGLGADILNGNDGDDTFDELGDPASADGDVLNGNAGSDTVDYSARTEIIEVALDTVADDGEDAEADKVSVDVENVITGSGADIIVGSTVANRLEGGAGTDTISGGDGDDVLVGGDDADTLSGGKGNDTFVESLDVAALNGADEMVGNDGVDTVTYADRSNAVDVTMDATGTVGSLVGTASGEATEADLVGADIENLIGGAGGDTLTGNALDNTIEGGADVDTLNGLGGDDVLDGGLGADFLFCGASEGDINLDATFDTTDPTECEL
jgi:Ca2+-binding RTX toxin-like protein